jgi:hypothetical protein
MSDAETTTTTDSEESGSDNDSERYRRVAGSTFIYNKAPEAYAEWAGDLPRSYDLDNHTTVEKHELGFRLMEPQVEPVERPDPDSHRSGTCFDEEQTEMRGACVDTLNTYLDTDAVVHEVRHQRQGYHTDLVYADVDPEGLRQRLDMVTGTDPLHDPQERFRVWWYIHVNGPIDHEQAVEDGKYADAGKNRKHIDSLLQQGYLATNAAGALVAAIPPSISDLHAVELKRRKWEKALEQAARARRCDTADTVTFSNSEQRYGYADYAWVALDAGAIDDALANIDRFREQGVGLLAITEGGTVVEHLSADHRPRGRYTRDRAWVESEVFDQVADDTSLAEPADSEPVQATLNRCGD